MPMRRQSQLSDATESCPGAAPRLSQLGSLTSFLVFAIACSAPVELTAQAPWSVDPRPVLTIAGTTPGGDIAFGFPTGGARFASGEIAVADGSAAAPQIVFFDAQGRKVRSVGRSGDGPGEFRIILWMAQCAPDTLFAYDLMLDRVTVTARNGEFVRQFRPTSRPGVLGCTRSGALAIVGAPAQFAETSPAFRSASAPLSLYDSRGNAPGAFGAVSAWDLAYTDFAAWMPRLGGRLPSVTGSRDRVYVGPSDSSAIMVFAMDGRRLGSLPVRVRARSPSRRHLEGAVDYLTSFGPGGAERAHMRERFIRVAPAERLPPFSALTVDPDGVLWANLSVPGDTATVLRALDPSGRVLGEVRIAVELKVFEIGRDYVLGTYEDRSGEPVVALYRLRRGS
jgi:hypothetical protein